MELQFEPKGCGQTVGKYSFDYIWRSDKLVQLMEGGCNNEPLNKPDVFFVPADIEAVEKMISDKITDCFHYTLKGESLFFIEEREYGGELIYFRVTAKNDFPFMRVNIYAVKEPPLLLENSPVYRGNSRLFCSFLAEYLDAMDEFMIKSVCVGGGKLAEPFSEGEHLRYAGKTDEIKARLFPAMKACRKGGASMNYYDFIGTKASVQPVRIILRPVSMEGRDMILTEMYFINSEYGCIQPDIISGFFGNLTAFAQFCILENGQCYLMGMNPFMEELIVREGVKPDEVTSSAAFRISAESMLSAGDELIHEDEKRRKIRFMQTCVPLIRDQRVKGMFVSLIQLNTCISGKTEALKKLTPREREVVGLVAEGLTNRYIARNLRISEGTVKKNLYNCYRKLEVSSRTEVVKMIKNGIL